ncbi:MAG: DUF3800 domain-containing protein [Chloroflexi bacterium]|nr:DUF3800 domain-containing protein [Chloroflexota bacterium]
MIFFYMDESGTGLKDKNSHYFVLSAFALHSQDWKQLDKRITVLKRSLVSWAKPEDWEIKGRDLRRGDNIFQNYTWSQRSLAFVEIADFLQGFPCQLFVVQVDKRLLPHTIETDSDLYRIAFWRLLDTLNQYLESQEKESGMLLVDMRSDMHSSVQDRRLIDAYREWLGSYAGSPLFVELPWFGFSNFYAGVQLADYIAYLTDFVSHQEIGRKRSTPLHEAFSLIESKLHVVQIP